MKIVTYADVLVILVTGVFLFVINVIKKGVSEKVRVLAAGCGLNINSTKPELVLFSRSRILEFNLSRLNKDWHFLCSYVKYSGVALDPR